MVKQNPLVDKSKAFALSIINLCEALDAKKKLVISNQILRSGTSVGANIREAQYAISKADFTSKMQIALKECSETEYWLELIAEAKYINEEKLQEIKHNCLEIKKMLISSCKTSKF